MPDILEKRGPYRADHLEGAKKMVSKTSAALLHLQCFSMPAAADGAALPLELPLQAAQQKLVMAGAVGDPVDGAAFIFKNVSKEVRALPLHLCCHSADLHIFGAGALTAPLLPSVRRRRLESLSRATPTC